MKPYNIFYDNRTGRVIIQNNKCDKLYNAQNRLNTSPIRPRCISPSPQPLSKNDFHKKMQEFNIARSQSPQKKNDFYKKIEELSRPYNEHIPFEINNTRNMFSDEIKNGDSFNNNNRNNNNNNTSQIWRDYEKETVESGIDTELIKEIDKLNNNRIQLTKEKYVNVLNNDINNDINNAKIIKKDLTYGIKKTILSDFNYLYASSNCNDFKIGLNKNNNQVNTIFDVFYLFPNISEINTKSETNIINEKKVEIFQNRFSNDDKQYFPIDYIPCGVTIPLRTNVDQFTKLKIKNIFWNIFQSIDANNYKTNELLAVVPDKNEFSYLPIALQINFELHSQVSDKFLKNNNNQILPYKNNIKSLNPANSCLFSAYKFTIENLNGSNFSEIDIDIPRDLNIDCAILCIKISVPDAFISILKGTDKYNKVFYGFIPFSQFVLNFDYELSL